MNDQKLATLKRDIRGKYTTWRKGEIVTVTKIPGMRVFSIGKLKRKPNGIVHEGLPLFNELAGVRREALQIHR